MRKDSVHKRVLSVHAIHGTTNSSSIFQHCAACGAGDAVNMLVYGAKRWALLPPTMARYSTMPARQWFSTQLPQLLRRSQGSGAPNVDAIQCIQRPGEAMFVPEGWGHAVLNLQPSVGFATELAIRAHPLAYQPGEQHVADAEVHEVPWCNHRRWVDHLYTCREL